MSKQTRTKIPAGVDKVVNTVTGKKHKVDNVSRETGWYRVIPKNLDVSDPNNWQILYFNKYWNVMGGGSMYDHKFLNFYHVPEQTPVNPVPADESSENIMVQTRNDDNDSWLLVPEHYTNIEDAKRDVKNFIIGLANDEYRTITRTIETRVAKEGDV